MPSGDASAMDDRGPRHRVMVASKLAPHSAGKRESERAGSDVTARNHATRRGSSGNTACTNWRRIGGNSVTSSGDE